MPLTNSDWSAIGDLALGSFEAQSGHCSSGYCRRRNRPRYDEAVLVTLANFDSPQVGELVLSRWHELAPTERAQATDLLLRRESWALQLVQHLQREGAALVALDPAHVARLQNFPSDSVRKVVQQMSADAIPTDRRQVFNDYRDAALDGGDASLGKAVFQKNCSTCHALDAASDTRSGPTCCRW